jgi:hypothetical protein
MSDERRTEREPENPHNTAAALIVAAARQSGLLHEIAEVLRYIDHTESPGMCRTCALRDKLAEDFDEHAGLPAIVREDFYGDGFDIGITYNDAELAPYLE